jgi:3-hydroxybutyryl-CoA dehydratase
MYQFDDYYIGQQAIIIESFTAENVLSFAQLSGDFNPIHIDEAYSKKTHFKKCIVHGTYVTSVIGTVLGTKLPGLGTVLISQEHKFLKPVFVGDTITLSVEIVEIKSEKKIISLDIKCINSNNELLITGKATTKKIY